MGGVKIVRGTVGDARELSELDRGWDEPEAPVATRPGETSSWTAQFAVGTIDTPPESVRPPPIPASVLLPRARPPSPLQAVPAGTGSIPAHAGTWSSPHERRAAPIAAPVAPAKRDHDATAIVKPLPTSARRRTPRRTKAIVLGAVVGLMLGTLLLVLSPRRPAPTPAAPAAPAQSAPARSTGTPRTPSRATPAPQRPASAKNTGRRGVSGKPAGKKRVAAKASKATRLTGASSAKPPASKPGGAERSRPRTAASKPAPRTAAVPAGGASERPRTKPARPSGNKPAAPARTRRATR